MTTTTSYSSDPEKGSFEGTLYTTSNQG